MMHKISSTDFIHDPKHSYELAENAPVEITRKGKVSVILLTIQEYERLKKISGGKWSILN